MKSNGSFGEFAKKIVNLYIQKCSTNISNSCPCKITAYKKIDCLFHLLQIDGQAFTGDQLQDTERTSVNNEMTLHFTSDSSNTERGFMATYTTKREWMFL